MAEAEVEVGVAAVVAEAERVILVGIGGGEDGLGIACACEESVNFLHGDARVASDGDVLLTRFPHGSILGSHDAEEMPDGIFDVLLVDFLVALELRYAVFVRQSKGGVFDC